MLGSSHRLFSKRERTEDPSYQPSHTIQPPSKKRCRDDMHEPRTPETPILDEKRPKMEGGPESTSHLDKAAAQSTSRQESRPRVLPCVSNSVVLPTDVEASSRTEDQQRGSQSVPEEHFPETVSFRDMVRYAVDIVRYLQKYPNGLPRPVHMRILQTIQTDQNTTVESANDHWSDGKIWMQVLQGGLAANRRCTILNMLEYMGASRWYDRQIALAQQMVCTKENKFSVRRWNNWSDVAPRTQSPCASR